MANFCSLFTVMVVGLFYFLTYHNFNWQENLFYTVPSFAMETYRKSVESHFLNFEVNVPLSY